MCARVVINGRVLTTRACAQRVFPGARFGGFMRKERKDMWLPRILEMGLQPIEYFAERDERSPDGSLVWSAKLPAGQRCLVVFLVEGEHGPESRVLTRAATAQEWERYGHDRVPHLVPKSTAGGTT